MEHLLHDCPHYAAKVCSLAGPFLIKALAQNSGDYVPALLLTPLEFGNDKPHPSILLHLQDATTRKTLTLLLQEIKQDIIYRHAQLTATRRQEELHPHIQAHLLFVIKKICSLLSIPGSVPLSRLAGAAQPYEGCHS
jgi:hypothetical protein